MCLAQFCLTATPWTIAHQAPLSMGLPRQEYWSGLPFLIKSMPPESPPLAGEFFFFFFNTTEAPGKLESPLEGIKQEAGR